MDTCDTENDDGERNSEIDENRDTSNEMFCIDDWKQSNTLKSGLYSAYQCQQFTDVILVIENREIKCHRVVLASMSPFFKTMFSCEMSEKYQERISLPYVAKLDIMKALVKYMYTGKIKYSAKDDSLLQLYLAANFIQLDSLVKNCIDYIVNNMNERNCLLMLQFALKCDCPDVLNEAKRIICEEFVHISKRDEFINVEFGILREILQWDELNIDSEISLLEFCRNWLQKDDAESRAQYSKRLLKYVRLPVFQLCNLKTALSDALVLKTLRPLDLRKLKRLVKYPLRKSETDFDYSERKSSGIEKCVALIIAAPLVPDPKFEKHLSIAGNNKDDKFYIINLNGSMHNKKYKMPEATTFAGRPIMRGLC